MAKVIKPSSLAALRGLVRACPVALRKPLSAWASAYPLADPDRRVGHWAAIAVRQEVFLIYAA
jgi:hypothetical protein